MGSHRKGATVTVVMEVDQYMDLEYMGMATLPALELARKLVLRSPVVPPCVVSSLTLVPAFVTRTAQRRVTAAPIMPTFVEFSVTSTLDHRSLTADTAHLPSTMPLLTVPLQQAPHQRAAAIRLVSAPAYADRLTRQMG